MRIAAFIDGPNLHATAKGLGLQLDYARILAWLRDDEDHLVRAFYYTALLNGEKVDPLRPLTDYLGYNGYQVVTKTAKEFKDNFGAMKIKGNMDVDLAMDMIEFADNVEHIYLFSGDGDFRRLIEGVQRKGCGVTVVSSLQSNPPMCSDELRRQADQFIDLADVGDKMVKIEGNGQRFVR